MDAYEALDVIGSGSFGVIRRVRRKSDGRILVRKEIEYSKMSEKEKKQLVSEVNILRELRHPNIVRYYERFVDRGACRIYIIMEWCEGGDLAGIIKQCKKEHKRIPEEVVWNLLTQLLLALQECHHGGGASGSTSSGSSSGSPSDGKPTSGTHPTILHRDIKPDNVFLDGAQNVKLGDFGLSRIISNPEVEFAKTFVGTPFYMSPELVSETSYNTKSDIWALGCLIYELCSLEPPFQSKTQAGLTQKIQQGRIDPLPPQYSSELMSTIKAMLSVNHMKRPSTTEFLKLNRIRMCIKERTLLADIKKREDEVKRREAAVESREVDVKAREDEVMRLWKQLEEEKSRVAVPVAGNMGSHNVSGRLFGGAPAGVGIKKSAELSRHNSMPIPSMDDNPFAVDDKKTTLPPSSSAPVSARSSTTTLVDSTSARDISARPIQPSSTSNTNANLFTNKTAYTSLPRATASSVSSPSPFRRGIQLRTQPTAPAYGKLHQPLHPQQQHQQQRQPQDLDHLQHSRHNLAQAASGLTNENRAPSAKFGSAPGGHGAGYEKVALRAIGSTGAAFRSGMTPRKETSAASEIGSPMQLSTP
ncbi:G2-specific serine/threonine protein kinase [Podochytrium sp. JEL0797]|nr:G2-specific serine/threonine protein kinase [Podochytrium sp. JEL0797]